MRLPLWMRMYLRILRTFDLSDDISMRFKPSFTPSDKYSVATVGMGLQLKFK